MAERAEGRGALAARREKNCLEARVAPQTPNSPCQGITKMLGVKNSRLELSPGVMVHVCYPSIRKAERDVGMRASKPS